MKFYPLLIGLFLLIPHAQAAEPLTVEEALSTALKLNPEVRAAEAKSDAEFSAIRSQYWIDRPKAGFMYQQDTTLMEVQNGPMTAINVFQDIDFPLKYLFRGSAQQSQAAAAEKEFLLKKLEVRQKVLTGYFNLYSSMKIVSLLQAQKETIREIVRIAEARRATGQVPQQDEMKAHVEQTKIESDLLLAKQDLEAAEAMLNALLNRDAGDPISFPGKEIQIPKITVPADTLTTLQLDSSPMIKREEFMVEQANTKKGLALLNYFPDMTLWFQKPFHNNMPPNAYSLGIEFSVPLWFFMKESSDVDVASRLYIEADKNLEFRRREVGAEVRSLGARVRTQAEILKIFDTSLIPQATTALNSSRGAYQAGEAKFIELLDSERSLYAVRISFYQTLTEFVENVTRLEQVVGRSISSLPLGELS
ncbi:MAG TPA: TolC family protein [Bdellovibrionota bacterium]|nr:TolC family protein [Bdellovibrionota bacterium]